jgi:hypothetical protein
MGFTNLDNPQHRVELSGVEGQLLLRAGRIEGVRRQRLVAQIASELRHTGVVPAAVSGIVACVCR